MAKPFFEVFPTLKVGEETKNLLSEVEVTRVSTNTRKDILRVYIAGRRLIPKKKIYQLETGIKKQLFPTRDMTIKFIEKFQLSSQYTPENLMNVYKDSILLELREYSLLVYNLFRQATLEFDREDHMVLTLPDTIVAEKRSDELIDILEKIVCERCGLKLMIEPQFQEEAELSEHRKDSDIQIAHEVEHIVKMSALGQHREDEPVSQEKEETKPLKEKETKKQPAPAKTFKSAKPREEGRKFSYRRSDNPDVIYGRDFDEEAIAIETIAGEMGEVVIRGQILSLDTRPIRNEKTIVIMSVTDFTDTIVLKIFARDENLDELLGGLKKGAYVKIKGVTTIDKFDSELTIGSVVGIKKIPDFTSSRMDNSPKKRVELHCHTKMSDMDGVSDVGDIIKRAAAWGHKAIAITDHGAVQAFPIANHAIPDGTDFKVIYGLEAYLVDDLKDIIENSKNQSLDDRYVVFDLETTGLSPNTCKIIEIGAVKVENGQIVDRFSTFVNPKEPIPYKIEELTSIRDDMVIDAPTIEEILPEFMKFCEGSIMVAHNAEFDMSFIKKNCDRQGISYDFTIGDTMTLAQLLLPNLNRFRLDTVAKAIGVHLGNHHRAVDDAACTADIFLKFIEMLKERGIHTLDEVNAEGNIDKESVRKMKSFHAIMLATNDIGRVNLYKLVSLSHLTYFNKRPKIPKSEFVKYREGILLGSACEAGELYQAILLGRPNEEIARLVNFYDYLEIQPLGNNMFMLRDEKSPVSSIEELQDINRKIVALGEEFHKLVVATCDVHFLDPEDEVYRRIILAGNGFKDADDQAPLYLRTTEEMLNEFTYLGSEKAEEVVIKNPNLIADMCERISPVRPDKCPPVIENSDQMLRDICYNKAHEMYGEELPSVVKERLEP